MARWLTRFPVVEDAKANRRKAAVASVYGKNSCQAADLYFRLGELHWAAGGLRESEISYSYFSQSLEIYEKNYAINKSIDALCWMAKVCANNDRAESKRLYTEAEKLLAQTHEPIGCMTWQYLYEISSQLGETRQAESFEKRLMTSGQLISKHNETSLAMLFLLSLSVFASCLGQVLVKEVWLQWLRCRTNARWVREADPVMSMRLFDDLVSLDLYKRNLAAAFENSGRLLKMAEQQESGPVSGS